MEIIIIILIVLVILNVGLATILGTTLTIVRGIFRAVGKLFGL